jgi:hypothetical protein
MCLNTYEIYLTLNVLLFTYGVSTGTRVDCSICPLCAQEQRLAAEGRLTEDRQLLTLVPRVLDQAESEPSLLPSATVL